MTKSNFGGFLVNFEDLHEARGVTHYNLKVED